MDAANPVRSGGAEREAIYVVAAYERAFNNNDAIAMNALFADDASFVNFSGRLVVGRQDLGRAQEFVFADGGPLTEVRVAYDVEHVVVIAEDVAIVHARQRSRDHEQASDPMEAIFTVVVQRGRDRCWRIKAGQNTPVVG